MEGKKQISDKVIDFIFSKDYRKYLILIVILGGILRYLLVNNISFLGDEMVHGPHSINIISTNKIGMMVQSILWFYLTDLSGKLFGITAFSARFLSFFFGILSLILIYLVTKEIFSKKTAIISSFLLAISPFTLRYTLVEMDIAMMFFILLALYFFIKGLKEDRLSYMAALFLGIAALIKSIALFFALAFGVAYFYYKYKTAENKKEILKKKDWEQGIKFALLILLIFSPIIIYNLLLYEDKGIVDVMFAKFLNINKEMYSGQLGFDEGFSVINMFTGAFFIIKNIFLKMDPFIFILGLMGILLIYATKENRLWKEIILILLIIPFFIQTGADLLATHFIPYIPLLAIFASSSLEFIENKLKNNYKNILFVMLTIILFVSIFFLPINEPTISHLTSKSANIQMRDFAIEGIEDNAIVIADSRIYRGRIAWMFNDKFYIESSLLGELEANIAKMGGQNVGANVYFIECAVDDCGWGTVSDDQFNKTSESIVSMFKGNSPLIATFNGGGGYNEESNVPYYNVYKTQINIKPDVYAYIQSTHDWFYYPLRYFKDSFDTYNVKGLLNKIIDLFGHIILYFSIIITILSPVYLFYLLKKDNGGAEENKAIEHKLELKINKKWIMYIIGIILVIGLFAGYIHYTNKEMMVDHCNSLGLEMHHYGIGEVYCLNETDSSFRAFYYISKGLGYEITREMQLHDEWRSGDK